jgi:hypothetical protein
MFPIAQKAWQTVCTVSGMRARLIICIAVCLAVSACASLQQLSRVVQPPRFEAAGEGATEVRLVGPSADAPLGGANVRFWTTVTNPNPFGLTLSTVRATLFLEGTRAADGDFPLGLPLRAGQESTVPFDLTISFADVPALTSMLRNASASRPMGYRVDGTIGVEVGRLGTPTFGPLMLFSGELN